MSDERIQGSPNLLFPRVEKMALGESNWLTDAMHVASYTALAVSLVFLAVTVVISGSSPGVCYPVLRRKGRRFTVALRNTAASKEWWTRAQWALNATTSSSNRMYSCGAIMLKVLAKDSAVEADEKAILDVVWQTSKTKMEDGEIGRLLDLDSRDQTDSALLQREIQAAQLKVILDEEFGRPTSPAVMRLAAEKLPFGKSNPLA